METVSGQGRSRRLDSFATLEWLGGFVLLVTLVYLCSPLVELSADFPAYEAIFQTIRWNGLSDIDQGRIEPIFNAATWLFSVFTQSDLVVFCIFVFVALALKLRAILMLRVSTKATLICLAFYLARFGPLHELTQIRVAVATGLVLLAIAYGKRRIFWWLLFTAPLFHYSSVVFIPILLAWRWIQINPQAYDRLEEQFTTIAAIVALAVLAMREVLLEAFQSVFISLETYDTVGYGEGAIVVWSLGTILDIVLIILFIFLVAGKGPVLRFWLAVQVMNTVIFVSLSGYPVLAHRFHELLAVGWIPFLATAIDGPKVSRIVSSGFAAVCIPGYLYLYFFSRSAIFSLSQ